MRRRLLIQVMAVAALPLFVAPAFAAGEGGSSSGQTTTTCKKGEVWDKKKKKCVVPQYGMLDDDSIYEAGHDLAMVPMKSTAGIHEDSKRAHATR